MEIKAKTSCSDILPRREFATLIDELANDRVVDFVLSPDNQKVKVSEMCDEVFFRELNKHQMGRLIHELSLIHAQMLSHD